MYKHYVYFIKIIIEEIRVYTNYQQQHIVRDHRNVSLFIKNYYVKTWIYYVNSRLKIKGISELNGTPVFGVFIFNLKSFSLKSNNRTARVFCSIITFVK